MSLTISAHDKKNLEKYCKFFCLKSAQVIVQGRLGRQITTPCNTNSLSGAEWFNLAIKTFPDVQKESKSALSNGIPSAESSFMVEISLHTSEKESLLLEIWTISFTRKFEDTRVDPIIYNRMSLLLKSLMCVSRATPAYKLSQNQGSEFVICYRVSMGKAEVSGLGEGFKTLKVGSVGTPIGTLILSVAYRAPESLHVSTKKLILRSNSPLPVNSEHFCSPKERQAFKPKPCANLTSKIKSDGSTLGYSINSPSYHQLPTSFCTSPPDELSQNEAMFTLGTPPTLSSPDHKPNPTMSRRRTTSERQLYTNKKSLAHSTSEQVFLNDNKVKFHSQSKSKNKENLINGDAIRTNGHGDLKSELNGRREHWNVSSQNHRDNTKKEPVHVVVGFPDNAGFCSPSAERKAQVTKRLSSESIKSFKSASDCQIEPLRIGAFVSDSKTAARAQETLAMLENSKKLPFNDLMALNNEELSEKDELPPTNPEDKACQNNKSQNGCTSPIRNLLEAPRDEFIMVELNPAFGKSDSANDLGTFYRECENAPDLIMFQENNGTETEETLLDLTKHLEDYERDIEDFDNFVSELEATT